MVDDGKGSAKRRVFGFWAYILDGLYGLKADDNSNRAQTNCPSNQNYRSCVPAKNVSPYHEHCGESEGSAEP